MIGVTQTTTGGVEHAVEERGNCWEACLASILEVKLEDIGNFHSDAPEYDWWAACQNSLEDLGVTAVEIERHYSPRCFWIATVPSVKLRFSWGGSMAHSIVMKGEAVAWDPGHDGGSYPIGIPREEINILAGWVLVPLGEWRG